ncbi:MAG: SCO family protein [Anaerolineales bacterium]
MKAVKYWLYGFPLTLIILAMAFKVFQPIQVLPRIRLAPAFSLVDQQGQRLTSEDLRGKVTLYTFTYTRCAPPCRNPDETLLEIQRRLEAEPLSPQIQLQFVSVSFDPERDSPQILKAYQERLGANPSLWRFATLSDQGLLKTIIGDGFEVYYQPLPEGDFDFDPVFILVDGWGIIRGEYRYQTETPLVDRIMRHLHVLEKEILNSSGVARMAYEAAHLFLCYAQ